MTIDFDLLRQELTKKIVEGPEKRYQFAWSDKRNAIWLANAPIAAVITMLLTNMHALVQLMR